MRLRFFDCAHLRFTPLKMTIMLNKECAQAGFPCASVTQFAAAAGSLEVNGGISIIVGT